jgi:hypothetical protein
MIKGIGIIVVCAVVGWLIGWYAPEIDAAIRGTCPGL